MELSAVDEDIRTGYSVERDWIETANDLLESDIIQTFTTTTPVPQTERQLEKPPKPKVSGRVPVGMSNWSLFDFSVCIVLQRGSHGGFSCSLCSLMFATRHSVRRHAIKEHGDVPVTVNSFDASNTHYTYDLGDRSGDFWGHADIGEVLMMTQMFLFRF